MMVIYNDNSLRKRLPAEPFSVKISLLVDLSSGNYGIIYNLENTFHAEYDDSTIQRYLSIIIY